MKALIEVHELRCDLCLCYLISEHDLDGKWEYVHREFGTACKRDCPNAGKRYKHPSVELEEIQPS